MMSMAIMMHWQGNYEDNDDDDAGDDNDDSIIGNIDDSNWWSDWILCNLKDDGW